MEKFEPIITPEKMKTAREVAEESVGSKRHERMEAIKSSLPKEEKEIFKIQVAKQRIMVRLKGELRRIEQGQDIPPVGDARVVNFRPEDRLFEPKFNKDGITHRFTFGDIMSDMRWGVQYHLGKDVPKSLRKRWVMERAKTEIADLYDRQLLEKEIRRHSADRLPYLKNAYEGVWQQMLQESYFAGKSGLIFERMIGNLLRQIMHDKSEWGIKIGDMNVVEDVEGKIDFVIKVKRKGRGVNVEEREVQDKSSPETTSVLGIQFTLRSEGDEKFKEKMERLEQIKRRGARTFRTKLEDLIIVSVPVSSQEIIRRYQQWKQLRKPPGGPEALWDINTRVAFVKAVLRQMGIDDLLEEKEEELREYYNSRLAI